MACFFDRHGVLAHGLEEGGLGSRGGAIDLIGQHHVGKQRTRQKLELPLILAVDRDADDVRGQGVGGELDAVKLEIERACEGLGEGRLPDPWNILEQHVATRQQGSDQGIDDLRLAANHPHD